MISIVAKMMIAIMIIITIIIIIIIILKTIMTITTEMNEAIHGALKKTEATEGRKVEEEIVTSILSNQVSESPVHTHHNVAYEHVRTFGCVTGQDLKGIEELRNITVSGIRLYGSINKCITL